MDFAQSSLSFEGEADPAQLLPQLLDQCIALGETAKQLSLALGGSGHRAGEAVKLIQELINERG